jgi:RND family efflux transporter MFP subunit
MKRNYLLPFLAVFGVAIAVFVILDNNRPAEERPLLVSPADSPFETYIAGAGIVEAVAGNIDIGTPVSGVVTDIYVQAGDQVKAGDALFKIDDRHLQAALLTAIAQADLAKTQVQKPEHRLAYLQKMQQSDASAVSASELSDLRDDLAQARAAYALSQAQVEQAQTEIALHTIRAPTDGHILQLHARLGQFAEAAKNASPILVFGRDDTLWVRVDLDESVIQRFQSGARAVAYLRGNPESAMPLKFLYTEPYVIPKQSLTGQSTERTDVRVLQVLYGFDAVDQSIFVGQQLDVFIEAKPETPQERGVEP